MAIKLLNAYNDYIEVEFNERRSTTLGIKLGLMYSNDEDNGDDVEMWYDTQSKMFFGTRNDEIVYELNADYDLATRIIESNDFNDYYNVITQGDELYGIN